MVDYAIEIRAARGECEAKLVDGTLPVELMEARREGVFETMEALEAKTEALRDVLEDAEGPRGPARKSALGPVAIAQMAGKPIVPMCWSVDRYWRATGWDRLIIPKPFARGRFIIGDPIYLDDISKDQLETARQQLENALNAQADAVDRLFTEPPQ